MIGNLKSFYTEVYTFLRTPLLTAEDTIPFFSSRSYVYILSSVGFGLILGAILSTTASVLANISGYSLDDNSQLIELLLDTPYIEALVLVSVIAPLLEEFAFRALLSKRVNVFVSGVILMLGFLALTFSSNPFIIFGNLLMVSITAIIGIGYSNQIKNLLVRNFRLILYISAVAFALAHLGNYTNLTEFWWLVPFLISTQFAIGLLYAFLRVRINLVSAIIAHSLYNGIIVSVVYTVGNIGV